MVSTRSAVARTLQAKPNMITQRAKVLQNDVAQSVEAPLQVKTNKQIKQFKPKITGQDIYKSKKVQAIYKTFTDPKSPACYSSAYNVFNQVKKQFKSITKEEVDEVLEQLPAYTLHKGRRLKFKLLKTVPRGYMTDV